MITIEELRMAIAFAHQFLSSQVPARNGVA
jgi:hypothetical protein